MLSSFFEALEKYQKDETLDFLDGTIFGKTSFVLVLGQFQDTLEGTLDNFVNDKIYWRSIQTEKEHWFKTIDYIYRWDTDMYYTSMVIPQWLNNSMLRKCIPAAAVPSIKKALPYIGINNNVLDICIGCSDSISKDERFLLMV